MDGWMDPKSFPHSQTEGVIKVCFCLVIRLLWVTGCSDACWEEKSVKDWLTCHDPKCNPGGVSMCLSVPLWVETQWRTPLLRPVSVNVFSLFTMIVFVVKTKAIMTITSASFSDHKTTNTHENAPSPPKSHPDTRLLRRERESEGGKEGEKEAREGEEQLKRCVFSSLRWTVEWIRRKKEKLPPSV